MYVDLLENRLEKRLGDITKREIFPKSKFGEINPNNKGIGLGMSEMGKLYFGDNPCFSCRYYVPKGVTISDPVFNPCFGQNKYPCNNYVNKNAMPTVYYSNSTPLKISSHNVSPEHKTSNFFRI